MTTATTIATRSVSRRTAEPVAADVTGGGSNGGASGGGAGASGAGTTASGAGATASGGGATNASGCGSGAFGSSGAAGPGACCASGAASSLPTFDSRSLILRRMPGRCSGTGVGTTGTRPGAGGTAPGARASTGRSGAGCSGDRGQRLDRTGRREALDGRRHRGRRDVEGTDRGRCHLDGWGQRRFCDRNGDRHPRRGRRQRPGGRSGDIGGCLGRRSRLRRGGVPLGRHLQADGDGHGDDERHRAGDQHGQRAGLSQRSAVVARRALGDPVHLHELGCCCAPRRAPRPGPTPARPRPGRTPAPTGRSRAAA